MINPKNSKTISSDELVHNLNELSTELSSGIDNDTSFEKEVSAEHEKYQPKNNKL